MKAHSPADTVATELRRESDLRELHRLLALYSGTGRSAGARENLAGLLLKLLAIARSVRDDMQAIELFDCADELSALTTDLAAMPEKWRRRASPNFADPEADDLSLEYWKGVLRCADELAVALAHGGVGQP